MRSWRIIVCTTVALVAAACTSQTTLSTTSSTTTTTTRPPIHPLPVVDTAATPKDWVQVDYGDAQVSVPAAFSIFYPGQNPCEGFSTPGALFVASKPTTIRCPQLSQQGTAVRLLPVRRVPMPYASEKPTILNGVSVYLGPNGVTLLSYYAPSWR